jgi:hypothetical protein
MPNWYAYVKSTRDQRNRQTSPSAQFLSFAKIEPMHSREKQLKRFMILGMIFSCQLMTAEPVYARCLEKYQKSLAYLELKGKEFTDLSDLRTSLTKSAEAARGKWQWSMGSATVLSNTDMLGLFEFLEARYPSDMGKTDERTARRQLRKWQNVLADRLEVISLLREAVEERAGPTSKRFLLSIQKQEPRLRGLSAAQFLEQVREWDEQGALCPGGEVLSGDVLLTEFIGNLNSSETSK